MRIIAGDCRDVLATLDPDSIEAVITDPPYHLIQGGAVAEPRWRYKPASRTRKNNPSGFMRQEPKWDTAATLRSIPTHGAPCCARC